MGIEKDVAQCPKKNQSRAGFSHLTLFIGYNSTFFGSLIYGGTVACLPLRSSLFSHPS